MRRKTATTAAGQKPSGFSRVVLAGGRLPGVETGMSYGTPALRVKGKLFARVWEDGETLVLKVDFDSRDAMLKAQPGIFFVTDHYRGYPAVLARLSMVKNPQLRILLEDSWRFTAPKKLLAQLARAVSSD
ncbi:MAG: MmcQ/YjbR family DNA-binding protein [Gemmatimonadales bacterium]